MCISEEADLSSGLWKVRLRGKIIPFPCCSPNWKSLSQLFQHNNSLRKIILAKTGVGFNSGEGVFFGLAEKILFVLHQVSSFNDFTLFPSSSRNNLAYWPDRAGWKVWRFGRLSWISHILLLWTGTMCCMILQLSRLSARSLVCCGGWYVNSRLLHSC